MSAKSATRKTRTLGITLALAIILFATAPAAAGEPVAVVGDKGMWEMAYGDVYYRVLGETKNTSGKTLKYVKLEIDLLDKTGKVVATMMGYNQKAEFLAGVEGYDSGEPAEPFEKKLARVEPIKAGEKDTFRIGIGKNDIPVTPKFVSYKIRVVETK